jgi:chorismate mutase
MSEEKAIDIKELRIRLDQMNELIIIGLKTRSNFPFNSKTFSETFAENKSWFLYRLKKEQDLDAEYGRFLYNDQNPIYYTKEELSRPLIKGPARIEGITQASISVHEELIENYRKILGEICEKKEDRGTYGETTKLDVENIILQHARVVGLGAQVAGYKMQENPNLRKINDAAKLRKELVVPEREKEVVEKMAHIAEKYELKNILAVKRFAQRMIDLTTEAEIRRILNLEQ